MIVEAVRSEYSEYCGEYDETAEPGGVNERLETELGRINIDLLVLKDVEV